MGNENPFSPQLPAFNIHPSVRSVIYFHIPFCRRACHYCDFHFSTDTRQMDALVQAIVAELHMRNEYLTDRRVRTVYFGGGTPSMLPSRSIGQLLDAVRAHFSLDSDAEVTLEANPEDLTPAKIRELRELGINRLSLGTQSFIAHELTWMNRLHTPDQAIAAIRSAQNQGFANISIDLIFGLPDQTIVQWEQNLNTALSLDVQHISSYGLTVEERTKLHHSIRKGTQHMPDEAVAEACMRMNMDVLPAHGFEHYEISNYAREGFISRHNSAYWKGSHYFGLGPSAHSFDGHSRQWNIRSNAGYMQAIANGKCFWEREELTTTDRINEHIMTGLRCKWGVRKEALDTLDRDAWPRILRHISTEGQRLFSVNDGRIALTSEGRLMADRLTAELFQ